MCSSCDIEYVDIYSEVETVDEDILTSSLGGRYCGTVAPHVRISLKNVMKLILHSRSTNHEESHGFRAKYSFIPEGLIDRETKNFAKLSIQTSS